MAAPGAPEELHALIKSLKTPDVLIVDGGINDVSAFHIVAANPFDPDGAKQLESRTRTVFQVGGPVHALLETACERFPKATIIVTGYYRIVSPSTDLGTLTHLLRLLPGAGRLLRWFGRFGHLLPESLLEPLVGQERRNMAEQCRIFHQTAHECLSAIVAGLHAKGFPICFADPGFTDANSYGAPDTWLWDGSDDPMLEERERRFALELAKGNPDGWPLWTSVASMCHPNAQGSAAYAKAVLSQLAGAEASSGAVPGGDRKVLG
jgi:hypothetical protein